MIDATSEQMITLENAAPMFPGSPAERTVYRWAKAGLHGIKLETVLFGRRYTSVEAVRRFTEKVTKATA